MISLRKNLFCRISYVKILACRKKCHSVQDLDCNICIQDSQKCSLSKDPPLVVLIGWADALPKHLEKYAEIYRTAGFSTLMYSPAVPNEYFQTQSQFSYFTDRANSLLRRINKLGLNNRVVFHLFSNNGANMLKEVLMVQNTKDVPKVSIDGVIFDSGPADHNTFAKLSFLYHRKSISKNSAPVKVTRAFISLCFTLLFHRPLFLNFYRFPLLGLNTYFQGNQPPFPCLFLHSKRDLLMRMDQIQALIETRNQLGYDSHQQTFKKAMHVQLFRENPSLYKSSCLDFIQKIC